MTLKEKLQNAETYLVGNRVACLGAALLAGGQLAIYIGGRTDPLTEVVQGLATIAGSLFTVSTRLGFSTMKTYRDTKNHLKKFNSIDRRFFETEIGPDKDKNLAGYCPLQGMYLACRDAKPELLPEFYRLKKEKTKNIIPNF